MYVSIQLISGLIITWEDEMDLLQKFFLIPPNFSPNMVRNRGKFSGPGASDIISSTRVSACSFPEQ